MEQVTKASVVAILQSHNQGVALAVLRMYADLYIDYTAAQRNIDEHGTIVFHPKTGAPIRNPFLDVRDSLWGRLQKSEQEIDTTGLWEG
jgi:phage terminase small subunit